MKVLRGARGAADPPRDRYPREVTDLLPEIAILAGFAAIMAGLVWLTHRSRGRRVGSSVAGPFEEIWHPAAHRARIDIETQDERRATMLGLRFGTSMPM